MIHRSIFQQTPSARVDGYTLIEVLVAMMILAMALTVLMRMFSGGLQNISTSADYAHAVVLAEAQLAATGSSEATVPGQTYGREDKFRWTRSVEEYYPVELGETETLPVAAYQVTLVVEWPGRARPRRLSLTTIKLDRLQGAEG
jgi:general secretion pathway protein I